jgi:hypothetical protein
MQVGTAVNRVRSEWQCSRVYAVLGREEPALWHARRCLAICELEGIGDFDLGFAYESLARAHAVAGDPEEAKRWLEQAHNAAAEIAEDDDRELLLSDLETVPDTPGPGHATPRPRRRPTLGDRLGTSSSSEFGASVCRAETANTHRDKWCPRPSDGDAAGDQQVADAMPVRAWVDGQHQPASTFAAAMPGSDTVRGAHAGIAVKMRSRAAHSTSMTTFGRLRAWRRISRARTTCAITTPAGWSGNSAIRRSTMFSSSSRARPVDAGGCSFIRPLRPIDAMAAIAMAGGSRAASM